jgi:hypothetical protein
MKDILSEAKALVSKNRRDAYGSPVQNHGATADLFSAYLKRRYGPYMVVPTMDAQDVCVFNICQKISRLANTPGHRDSLVDIAGYAANIAEL